MKKSDEDQFLNKIDKTVHGQIVDADSSSGSNEKDKQNPVKEKTWAERKRFVKNFVNRFNTTIPNDF